MKYFAKNLGEVDAVQWFKHGDHPKDHHPIGTGDPVRYDEYVYNTPGKVVKPIVTPYKSTFKCVLCHKHLESHGRLKTPEGKLLVCPGNWIVTTKDGTVFSYDSFVISRDFTRI